MKRSSFFFATVVVLATLSGCGGGSVAGSVSGISLAAQDSIFLVLKDDAGKTQSIVVLIADKPNICDTLKANREPKASTSLAFTLLNVKIENNKGSLLAPDVGSYTVTDQDITASGTFARSSFTKTDANCTQTLTTGATTGKSGLVKISSLNASSSGSLVGTFDVSIGTQSDKLTGTLNARFCDVTKIQANPNCE